jgi:hypothetical protein
MKQYKVSRGSRKVVITAGLAFSSRLYVNRGETSTTICAKHKTLSGAHKWAAKVLSEGAHIAKATGDPL